MDSSSFTCQNPSCGKTFANPLKTEVIGSRSSPYEACPYCLSEITVAEDPVGVEAEQEVEIKKTRIKAAIEQTLEEKSEQFSAKGPACNHHLGYLSKRSSSEKIPDECMTCENIVQCMLKTITG